jgi:soluble lytic murein transglycosylase-like protein
MKTNSIMKFGRTDFKVLTITLAATTIISFNPAFTLGHGQIAVALENTTEDEMIVNTDNQLNSEALLENADVLITNTEQLIDDADSILYEQKRLAYKYEEIPLENSVKNKVITECEKYNIDPDFIFGIFYIESDFTPTCASSLSTARGLGQFLESTGKFCYESLYGAGTYNHDYAFDPYINIEMTCFYINYLNNSTGGNFDYDKILTRYRGLHVQSYIDKILNFSQNLKERERNFNI